MDKQKYIKNKIAEYYKNQNKKMKIEINYMKLKKEKVIYRIIHNLSTRIYMELNKLNIKKTFKYTDILGCSIKEFEIYLLENMKEGMNFENYGKEWHVDHITAMCHFDFNKLEDIVNCCHYTNLQPLWAIDNWRKNKY